MDYFKSPRFADRVDELIEEWHVSGIAAAVIQNDDIQSQAFGKASLKDNQDLTPETLLDIASSSKSLTAAAVAMLVEDDDRYPQVQWNAKMSDLLLDDFVMASEQYTKDVTVEDVLSHRTGQPRHDSSYLGVKAKNPDTARSVTRSLRHLPVAEPIRTKFIYNNMMYTVASYLVEKISGMTFSEFLHKNIFEPLNMNKTNLQPSEAIAAGLKDYLAQGYYWHKDSETFREVDLMESPEDQGAGSIITSVNDYIKWVKALMNHEDPITQGVYKSLTTPRIVCNPTIDEDRKDPYSSPLLYTAGLETNYYRGYQVIKHDGLIAGFTSSHFFLPKLKFGAVILGNSTSASDIVETISMELIDAAIGTPESVKPDWNEIQKAANRRAEEDERDKDRRDPSERQPLEKPLSTYFGTYGNAGYHELTVEERDGKLFADAYDRSFGFYLTFEHYSDGKVFEATLIDYLEGEEEKLDAEFQFEGDRVMRMGIKFEEDLDDMIWFDRIDVGGVPHHHR